MDRCQEKEKFFKKKLLCPLSTDSGIFDGSFRAPICKSGTKSSPGLNISGPRCSQIQKGFNASPFSGPNIAGSASADTNVHSILNDPEVRSLERLLRVKAKVENQGLPVRLPGRLLDNPLVSVGANRAEGRVPLLRGKSADQGVGNGSESLLENHVSVFAEDHAIVAAAHETAGVSDRTIGLLDERQPVSSKFLDSAFLHAEGSGDAEVPESVAHATAGESEEIIGLHVSHSSFDNSSNSLGCVAAAACARLPAMPSVSARVCPVSSSSAVSAAVAHARSTPMHDAHNSWSDTVRVKGPTGTRRVKGGVSSPAEDLRPVSEVEAGVNFRPAGWVRGQVAGSLPGRQPGTGTRQSKGSVGHTFLHPEVPDSLSVSPGPGKRIRQLMGWTKVCRTAQSGIWVLKGNARACMFPANLDHLRVGWRKQGSCKTAWVTPGHDCLCAYKYGHGAAVRPQTNKAIWDGVISLWSRVAPFLVPWCDKKELPTGVNLNHYHGSRSCVRWHSDNESLFGPRDSPKLIVSLSLGNPVEFKVRRVSDSVTSSIPLDHGDVLVMDGSAQWEYLHCSMPGLQGPRVNLTYRWVAQHTASCPLAGVVGCLLPSCVQGLAEPGSRLWDKGENNWSFSWGLAFLLFILMTVPLVSIWMNIRKECRHSGQRLSCSSVHFPLRGRARWVGGRRWPLSRRSQFSRKQTFHFPWVFFWGKKLCHFFRGTVFLLDLLLDMLVAKREPAPCYHDAYSVGIPKGAYGGKSGQIHCKTTVFPVTNVFFWLVNGLFTFSGGWWFGCFILVGLGILGLVRGLSFLVNCLSNLQILVDG